MGHGMDNRGPAVSRQTGASDDVRFVAKALGAADATDKIGLWEGAGLVDSAEQWITCNRRGARDEVRIIIQKAEHVHAVAGFDGFSDIDAVAVHTQDDDGLILHDGFKADRTAAATRWIWESDNSGNIGRER